MIYGSLTLSGTAQSGDVTRATLGGVDVSADHIEVLELHFGSEAAVREAPVGVVQRASGQAKVLPIRFLKRIDQTTPAFLECLHERGAVFGIFSLFDSNPDTGEIRHRFDIRFENGVLLAVRPSASTTAAAPFTEWIEIQPRAVTVSDLVNSREARVGG